MGISDFFDDLVDIFTWSPLKEIMDYLTPDMRDSNRGLEIQREGSDNALAVVYGERPVGGVVVHKYVTGNDSEFLHMIVAFCHGPVQSVSKIYLNDIPIDDSEYDGYVDFEVRQGTPDQLAIPEATSEIPNWNSQMRGKNVCYAWIRFLQIKEEQVWRGEPQVSALILGNIVYDWRTDTTGFSRNNAVCAVDYLTNSVFGRGLDINDLNLTQWTAAANFCDEGTSSEVERTVCQVEYLPPGYNPTQVCETQTVTESHPRYEMNAVLDSDKTVFDNYKELLSSFRASPNRTNGLIGVSVETVGEPEVVLTDDDLVGSVDISTTGQNNRYNRVIVRYPDKNSDNYKRNEVVYPHPDSQQYQDWLAEDNGKSLVGEYEFNTFSEQSDAEQTAEIIAKRSRIDKTAKFQARGIARLIVPGDIIALTVGSYGWVAQPVRITTRQEVEYGVFEFNAVLHDNAIYPWSGSSWSEQIGGTTLGTGVQIGMPSNLALTPDPTYANTGTLSWNLVSSAFVRYYEVELRNSAGVVLYDRTEYGREHTVPLLAPGSYNISVYAMSTIGRRSDEAELAFTLAIPIPPSDLGLVVSNNTIQSVPVLAGLNLGTQFEFDIVEGDGTGHTSESRIRARTGVFTGLIPSTEHTVFVRTVNALGASAWVSETAITTANTQELDGVLENAPPFLELADRAESAFYELEIDRRNYEGTGVELISTETGLTLFKWGQTKQNNAFAYGIQEINVAIGPDGALAQSITAVGAQVTNAEGNIVANADAIDELTARVGYCTLDGSPTADEDRASCEANGGTWIDDAPLAESIRATRVELGSGEFATFSQIGQTYQDVDGTLIARGAVLTNVNGQISGIVNVNTGAQSTLDFVADVTRIGTLDGGGAFVPKLLVEDVEGVPTLTFKGRIVLEDGFTVDQQSDIQGLDGTDGTDGSNGAGQYAGVYTTPSTTQSLITSRFMAVTGRAPVFGDIFTQVRSAPGFILTRQYDSAQWIEPPLLFVDGNLLATGTVAGDVLISNTLIQGPVFRTTGYVAGSSGTEINGQTGAVDINGTTALGRLRIANDIIEVTASGEVVAMDPAGNDGIVFWAGSSDISKDSRSRTNASFFIDSDGEYPRPLYNMSLVTTSFGSTTVTRNINFSVPTISWAGTSGQRSAVTFHIACVGTTTNTTGTMSFRFRVYDNGSPANLLNEVWYDIALNGTTNPRGGVSFVAIVQNISSVELEISPEVGSIGGGIVDFRIGCERTTYPISMLG